MRSDRRAHGPVRLLRHLHAHDPLITPIGVAEFILAAAVAVTLITGLAMPTWRRALRRVLWIGCVLAWLGGGYVYAWASTHP